MNGKGDKPRKGADNKKYRQNYDQIFKKDTKDKQKQKQNDTK